MDFRRGTGLLAPRPVRNTKLLNVWDSLKRVLKYLQIQINGVDKFE